MNDPEPYDPRQVAARYGLEETLHSITTWTRATLAIPGAWIDNLDHPDLGRWENGWKVEDAADHEHEDECEFSHG